MPVIESLSGASQPWLLLWLAAFLVGLSKGGLPGIGMLSVPVLSLVMSPISAAVLLLPIFILSDTVAVWLYRKQFSRRNLEVLIPAGLLGVCAGWATAAVVSEQVVSLLIGLMGMAFCLDIWMRRTPREKSTVNGSRLKGMFWGALSGFTSFVSHAGAPPYQIYVLPQKLPKMVFAGTTTIVFAAVNLAKVIPYWSLHPYTAETFKAAIVLLPAAIAGTFVGRMSVNRLADAHFFLIVQIALFLICTRLVFEAVGFGQG